MNKKEKETLQQYANWQEIIQETEKVEQDTPSGTPSGDSCLIASNSASCAGCSTSGCGGCGSCSGCGY